MVRSIQTENGSDLEELLSERVEIEHTSIMSTIGSIKLSTTWLQKNGPKNRRSSITSAISHVFFSTNSHHHEFHSTSLGTEF